MNISNRNKWYGVAVGAAVVGLLIDRVYFTPNTAAAKPRGLSAVAPVVAEAAAPVDAGALSEGTISSRLASINPPDWNHLSDAFVPPSTWVGSAGGPGAPPDQFVTAHKLSAVLESHNGGGAIVDGRLIRIGEKVDGFVLAEVGRGNATFVKGSNRVQLSLGI